MPKTTMEWQQPAFPLLIFLCCGCLVGSLEFNLVMTFPNKGVIRIHILKVDPRVSGLKGMDDITFYYTRNLCYFSNSCQYTQVQTLQQSQFSPVANEELHSKVSGLLLSS